MGVSPNDPFEIGIFPCKPSSYWGTPQFMKPPLIHTISLNPTDQVLRTTRKPGLADRRWIGLAETSGEARRSRSRAEIGTTATELGGLPCW